ncbi:MAG: DUF4838 domain-containing protein [Lachnospiraceae bacterium]
MLPNTHISMDSQFPPNASDIFCISLSKNYQDAESDSFQIDISNNGGSISGSNSFSVLAGVYHYLYLLGCRFLGPDPRCEVIPVLTNTAQLYQHISHTASHKHRGICLEGANSAENIKAVIDWLPKVGYNSFFLQFQIPYTFLARWYQHENNPIIPAESFTLEDAVSLTKTILPEIKKRGLRLHQVGHGWTGACLGVPSSDWKKADLALSDSQRSMLAEINGKRELFHGIPMNSNLCYSNPDVIHEFTKQVSDYALAHPEIDYLHVWLADEHNNICECKNCQDHLLADQYIHILNEIDQQLSQHHCSTKIVFLLYQELLWPPKTARFNHPERFVLMFAPISRTFQESYRISGELPEIPEFRRNHITLPVDLDENLSFLRAWQEIFTGDSFVYDYPLGRAHYGDFGYHHISKVISEDICQLDNLKLNGYISCQELRTGMPNFLPNYVMGRTLFDSSCSFDSLRNEYMQAAYGVHAEEVLDYLSRLSGLCSCDYFNGKGSRNNPDIARRMQESAQLTRSFSSSELFHSIEEQTVPGFFLKLLAYHCRNFPLLEEALAFLADDKQELAYEKWHEFCVRICTEEPDFQPFLDVYRIIDVSKHYTGFSSCLVD